MIKSVYTLLVVDGSRYKYELEPFFLNQKSKLLEPMSADSQSTPRHLKTDFGPVESIELLSGEVIELKNKENVALQLSVNRLNPLLDSKETKLKKTLLALQPQGPEALVSSLKCLLAKFHSPENELSVQQLTTPVTPNSKSNEGESENSEGFEGASEKSDEHVETVMQSDGGSQSVSRQLSITLDEHGDLYEDENGNNQGGSEDAVCNKKRKESPEIETEEEDFDDLLSEIVKVIERAEFNLINFQDANIPKDVQVDAELVQHLKALLQHTPDKTQIFVGVVCNVDENGKHGKYQVCVNAEIFVALFELQIEGIQICATEDSFYAVVHIITPENKVDTRSLVKYLNVNAKDFSDRVRNSTKYQDLVRFAATVVTNSKCSPESTTNFVKAALRGFSKGKILKFE